MELLEYIYFIVGFIIGIERMSRVTDDEDNSMACIGILLIVFFWPIYLVYKLIKKLINR